MYTKVINAYLFVNDKGKKVVVTDKKLIEGDYEEIILLIPVDEVREWVEELELLDDCFDEIAKEEDL